MRKSTSNYKILKIVRWLDLIIILLIIALSLSKFTFDSVNPHLIMIIGFNLGLTTLSLNGRRLLALVWPTSLISYKATPVLLLEGYVIAVLVLDLISIRKFERKTKQVPVGSGLLQGLAKGEDFYYTDLLFTVVGIIFSILFYNYT